MKFLGLLFLASLKAAWAVPEASIDAKAENGGTAKEDDLYWSRMMQDMDMSIPTPAPSPPPTPEPTPNVCLIEATIDCVVDDGSNTPCEELVRPVGQCSTGNDIDSLRFRITGESCDESENTQDEGSQFVCVDSAPLPAPGGSVEVLCVETGSSTVVAAGTVEVGTSVTIPNAAGGTGADVPDSITCIISSADGAMTRLQTVTIDTSGDADLFLKDTFGAMELEACDVDGMVQDCIVPLLYTYELENVGTTNMDITVVERTRGGMTVDLIDSVPVTFLMPGESTIVPDPEPDFDICVESTTSFTTNLRAEANPPSGVPCFDEDSFAFTINPVVRPPTPEPTPGPTAMPVPGPTPPPTPAPTPEPTPNPTPVPLTPEPTPGPTPEPTVLDVTPSPTDSCELDIVVRCQPPLAARSCDTIPRFTTVCRQRPFSMDFRYNGGGCENSVTIQEDDLFGCTDFNGAPPTQEGETSYIFAFELGGGDLYFQGPVAVGEVFNLAVPPGTVPFEVAPNMNITIFSDNPANGGILLQTTRYHSSCSQNLFLKDVYGAVQLVEFINILQGNVTCFENTTFTFDVSPASITSNSEVTLQSLVVMTNVGDFDLTSDVVGEQVTPDFSFTTMQNVVIDLTTRQTYTIESVITGVTDEGTVCVGTDTFVFEAGNRVPLGTPTVAPTIAPTITPFPTPDPEDFRCDLDVSVRCDLIGGRDCEVSPPANRVCNSNEELDAVRFVYDRTATCANSNINAPAYLCVDDDGGAVPRSNVVRVSVSPGLIADISDEFGQFTTFTTTALSGRPFDMILPSGVTEATVLITNIVGGATLQSFQFRIVCDGDSDIELLNNFGALTLAGFEDPVLGRNDLIDDFQITYIVENEGALPVELSEFMRTAPAQFGGGTTDILPDVDSTIIPPRSSVSVTQVFTLNFDDLSGSEFDFSATADGTTTTNDLACPASDNLTLVIG